MERLQALVRASLGPSPHKSKPAETSGAFEVLSATCQDGGMNALVSISSLDRRTDSADLDIHRIHTVPIVVISPHNQCDCHCVMCDIWKIRDAKEFSVADLERQIASFRQLSVRWVVLTGGEPQKNSRLPILAKMLRDA